MKYTALLISALLIAPMSATAGNENIFVESFCYKNIEKYVPGYIDSNGRYVDGYLEKKRKKIACYKMGRKYRHRHYQEPITHNDKINNDIEKKDDNSCVEGSILGGIVGGGAGAVLSRDDGRWWAIALGVVTGSMIGCQVDGG